MARQQGSSSVRLGEFRATDPGYFEATAAPWEIATTLLAAGSFDHRKRLFVTPRLSFYEETFSLTVRLCGLAPPGMLVFALPLRTGPRTTYWNMPPRPDLIPATVSSCVDVVIDPGQSHLVVMIPIETMQQRLAPEIWSQIIAAVRSYWLAANVEAALGLAAWLSAVLDTAAESPECFSAPSSVRAVEEELMVRLAAVAAQDAQKTRRATPMRRRGFDRALDLLRNTDAAWVSVAQLCTAANVSQRTLEYAFRQQLGLTPLAFMRLRRFHAARCDLMTALAGHATVAAIARSYGFFDLGRFAADYRRLFDEYPSETLTRHYPRDLGRRAPLVLLR